MPRAWPSSGLATYVGYAGGLGPENVEEQLPLIAQAAIGADGFWIDMETRVRSNLDRLFDLEKVERCLTILEPFVERNTGERHG